MATVELQRPVSARTLNVKHATYYKYDTAVERSLHVLKLRPNHDWRQRVVEHKLTISVDSNLLDYEDVFGNWTVRFELTKPYNELSIVAESIVEMLDVDPFAFTRVDFRPRFPVAWMPWEQKMLSPYISPAELPETQLTELLDYAQSFVKRNNGDLMETLFDLNLTFFREYQYLPGSTNLATTPYDVMVNKHGVCQDFANLFITLARLLNLPARYVCGYVYTGNTAEGNSQPLSDASHAWVQVYIPNVGWKGFDPTNGKLPDTDHVRVSVGRHYRDTAPTAGALYTMTNETLTVAVELTDIGAGQTAKQTNAAVRQPVAV